MTNTVRDLIQAQRELIKHLLIYTNDDCKICKKLGKKIKRLEKKILKEESI